MAKKLKISIAIDADDVRRIDHLASAQKVSRSAWFQNAIQDAIGQDEAAVKFFTDPLLRDTFVRVFSQPGVFAQMAKAMGEEVSPDQMHLFRDRLAGVVEPKKVSEVKKPRRPRGRKKA